MSEEEDFDQFFGEEEAELESRELEGVEDFSNEEEEELNGEEDSNEGEEINDSPTSASITLKSIKTPTDRGFIPYLIKLPGFINCKKEAFTEQQLRGELVEAGEFCDYGDLLRAVSTIRNQRTSSTDSAASNARFNRWSDGSWTLQIGQQHFEVCPQSFRPDEHSVLFARHPEVSCLEASARLASKLTVKPFMDQAGGSHRKFLALAEATGKGMKVTKVRVAATTVDPERQKQALVKMQQERIRAKRKLDAKRRNQEQRAFDRVGREGLSGRFLEEEDGDEDDEYWEKRSKDNDGADEDQSMEDEYEADFIDDEEVEVDDEQEDQDQAEPKSTGRTSRLIFDDDDDDE